MWKFLILEVEIGEILDLTLGNVQILDFDTGKCRNFLVLMLENGEIPNFK